MYTMLPWFKRWEENMNMQLLSQLERRAGFYLEFKIDSLLRGDAKSRAEAWSGASMGWFRVNDIRKLRICRRSKVTFIFNLPYVEAGTQSQNESIIMRVLIEDIYQDDNRKE